MGEHAELLLDGQPVFLGLQNAADLKWSGILRAMHAQEQVGVIVMRDGHVAWAVSNSQQENFSSFLERIGMVPKEKLDAVVEKYRSLGKSKKLGALLEEAGLISHAALRECLKAHVRAAIGSLLETPDIVLEARDGEMSVDASLIFLLAEVMPEPGNSDVPDVPVPDLDQEPVLLPILTGLTVLPGYLYSFVACGSGTLLAFHAADGVTVHGEHCVPAVRDWFSAALQSSGDMGMGDVQSAFVQSANGALFAHMADATKGAFVAVACNGQAKLGVVTHKLREMIPAVQMLMDGE